MSDDLNKESLPHRGGRWLEEAQTRLQQLLVHVRTHLNHHMLVTLLAVILALALNEYGFSPIETLAGIGMCLLAAYLIPLLPREKSEPPRTIKLPLSFSEDRLLTEVLNGMPEAAILVDPNGLVRFFNDRALVFCSMIQVGRHISTCIRNPDFLDAIATAPNSADPVTAMFDQRIPVDRRIEATVAGICDQRGGARKLGYMLITIRDLSEQETLARMRADFIANASHELRTPLASLQGFIETLQGPAHDDPAARDRFLGIMSDQSRRMTRLIDDLLSLSRIEMKAHIVPEERIEIGQLVHHVMETLEPIAREAGAQLHFDQPRQPLFVRGDRDELVQVFQNLMQNAIKHGREQGNVRVGAELSPADAHGDRKILVEVRDDGPGIAPEHLPRLVERFYRVNVADSRQKGGTGLGLAIVKHILARHNGNLRIASEAGKGSQFTVDIPLYIERSRNISGLE